MKDNRCQSERREERRVYVEIDIDLSTYGRYHLSKLTNMSIGGAFIRTKQVQPVGTNVRIKFSLPGYDKIIEAEGQVVWTYIQPGDSDPNSTGMGIRFTQILQSDRDRIKEFVAKFQQDAE